jgi:hypothetical protein
MRIALCISGLPRNVDNGYQNILNNLIIPNNPDIFIHTWGEDENLKNRVIELYQPKLITFEPQRIFVNDSLELERMMLSHGRSYTREKFVEMIYSSWYSVQASNTLKEGYRLANNIVYDYVIRARFDINYSIELNCAHYDRNSVYICNRELPDHDMADDRFAFGSNHNMNLYSSGFNFIDFICKLRDMKDGIFCGETLVYEMLTRNGIPYNKIHNLTCNRLPC